jgi:hypothetical protein
VKARIVNAVLAASLVWACGNSSKVTPTPTPKPTIARPDAGPPDGGNPDAGPDAGEPDAGPPDAGQPDGGDDGGTRPTGYNLPNIPGWQFFGVQNNGPVHVYGTAMDEGGNLWVAGGEEGLFLMTPAEQAKGSAAQFKQLTITDGLHPWGYMPDGGDAPGPYYLSVISVAGGPAGTVFVGYKGEGQKPNGDEPCENEWDEGRPPDPAIYKSGDADRVELQADGSLKVVHYDIFSGPGMVGSEPRGREKLCSIYKIAYNKAHNSVWFGGNHGFAWGDPNFPGAAATNCFGDNYGSWHNRCSGVLEHAHPTFGCFPNGPSGGEMLCSFRFYGIDEDSNAHLWVGGWQRSMTWTMSNPYGDFWGYEQYQFQTGFPYAIDLWPDPGGPQDTSPNGWHDDAVRAVVAMPDDSAYFASGGNGIAHVDGSGNVGYVGGEIDPHLTSGARDPSNGAVWFGGSGGISILKDGRFSTYSLSYFGPDLTANIADIQAQTVGGARKMVVGFHHTEWLDRTDLDQVGRGPDAVGVFSGSGLP